jgi:5-(carboxyamino)imidazole ribonucleotide synthase
MIVPPATIGMLGGGQLGRYALVAARLAGYGTIVLDPDPAAPAGRVADEHLVAAYDDPDALDVLAARCAVVTTEFENPPAAALDRLAAATTVAPPPAAVAVAQDRIAEKRFLGSIGVPVAQWTPVVATGDLVAARSLRGPAILKTARLGYDGKGQAAVERPEVQLEAAWDQLGRVPCVLEHRIPLDLEVSVVVARRADGWKAVYPVAENHHVDGILDLTVVPARVADDVAEGAWDLAERIADALEYVGVLAVEMFVSDGALLVNELAPRPHNSGHWTLDATSTDQFAQQVRAITGAALGDPSPTFPAVAMVNLLGDLWFPTRATGPVEPAWDAALAESAARLHLYGKAEPRPGRKMGHLTVLGDVPDGVAATALALRAAVTSAP